MAPKINITRKPGRRGKRSPIAGGVQDLPRSPGGIMLTYVRPRLPAWAQYGRIWSAIRGLTYCCQVAVIGALGYGYFFSMDDERREREARSFVFVRDERGQVCDIARDFQVDAALRAKKRSKRLLEGEEP